MLKLILIIAVACLGTSYASITIYSDSNTDVVGADMPIQSPAVPVASIGPLWSASIPGAQWIWEASTVTNPTINQICTFTRGFYLYAVPTTAVLSIAADHTLQTFANGYVTKCDCIACWSASSQSSCDIASSLKRGWNYIVFTVTNYGAAGATTSTNFGGLLYSLVIT